MKPSTLIKRGWCQGNYAKTKNGRPTKVNSKAAVKFCILGAIQRSGISTIHVNMDVLRIVRKLHGNKFDSLSVFNDLPGRKKKDVIKVLKLAGL